MHRYMCVKLTLSLSSTNSSVSCPIVSERSVILKLTASPFRVFNVDHYGCEVVCWFDGV